MDTTEAKENWTLLKNKGEEAIDPGLFARKLANHFMDQFFAGSAPDLEYIDILCRMAGSNRPHISAPAVLTLYKEVIEVLCDDFSQSGTELCNQVLIKVINSITDNPSGKSLAVLLTKLGYKKPDALLNRYQELCAKPPLSQTDKQKIKKILILSRVTVGADVAITGIILQRLAKSFPAAEFVMIGPRHLPDIFNYKLNLKFINFECLRQGPLADRLLYWPHLYDLIDKEINRFAADEVLLFDPDTRLSQLGLLPLAGIGQTFLFNSRSMLPADKQTSLTALTNTWLNQILNEDKFCRPKVKYSDHHLKMGQAFCRKLRANGCNHLISINLGVGDNPNKRLPDPFEQRMLTSLLERENTIILLDMGASSEEKTRVEKLITFIKSLSIDTDFVNEKNFADQEIIFTHGIIALQDSIGGFGAIINSSDCFFGYDSCCQHLANANKIPSAIIFTGHPNPRFIERWSPADISGATRIIPVENNDLDNKQIDQLVNTATTTLHNQTGS